MAIAVGIVEGVPVCDLEYVEDSAAETKECRDDEDGRMIEVGMQKGNHSH